MIAESKFPEMNTKLARDTIKKNSLKMTEITFILLESSRSN